MIEFMTLIQQQQLQQHVAAWPDLYPPAPTWRREWISRPSAPRAALLPIRQGPAAGSAVFDFGHGSTVSTRSAGWPSRQQGTRYTWHETDAERQEVDDLLRRGHRADLIVIDDPVSAAQAVLDDPYLPPGDRRRLDEVLRRQGVRDPVDVAQAMLDDEALRTARTLHESRGAFRRLAAAGKLHGWLLRRLVAVDPLDLVADPDALAVVKSGGTVGVADLFPGAAPADPIDSMQAMLRDLDDWPPAVYQQRPLVEPPAFTVKPPDRAWPVTDYAMIMRPHFAPLSVALDEPPARPTMTDDEAEASASPAARQVAAWLGLPLRFLAGLPAETLHYWLPATQQEE